MNGRSSERFAAGHEQLSAGGEGRDSGGGGRSSERFVARDEQLSARGEGRDSGVAGEARLSKLGCK